MSDKPNVPEIHPTRLTYANNGAVHVDMNARAVSFQCAHPDGLLGAYVVAIPIHTLKLAFAAINQEESGTEQRALAAMIEKQRQGPRIHRPGEH